MEKAYIRKVEELIDEFAEDLTKCVGGIHPDISEGVRLLKGNILNMKTFMRNSGATMFSDIIEASKDAHRLVPTEIIDSWTDIYDECGQEKGRGHFNRNRETHQAHVRKDGGLLMYQRCGNHIRTALRLACKQIPNKFEKSYEAASSQIEKDIGMMIQRHTAKSSNEKTAEEEAQAKRELQQALAPHFAALEKAWGLEPVTVEIPEDDDIPEKDDVEEEIPDSDAESVGLADLV